jgi:hypothetical protein
VWRWLRGLLLPSVPPVAPLDLDESALAREDAARRERQREAEAQARVLLARLRQLEDRLRYYDRREGDG